MWILAFICDPFQGCGILSSTVVQGMVFKRLVEGDVTKSENCKVAVYSCPLDIMQTETKVRSEHIDELVQERHNSSALAMELCLACTNPLIWEFMFHLS